jgi:hypothetical protein
MLSPRGVLIESGNRARVVVEGIVRGTVHDE